MKIRLDVTPTRCMVHITHNAADSGQPEVDIRTEGESLAEALAYAVDRFQLLQHMAISKMREVGLLRSPEPQEAKVVS